METPSPPCVPTPGPGPDRGGWLAAAAGSGLGQIWPCTYGGAWYQRAEFKPSVDVAVRLANAASSEQAERGTVYYPPLTPLEALLRSSTIASTFAFEEALERAQNTGNSGRPRTSSALAFRAGRESARKCILAWVIGARLRATLSVSGWRFARDFTVAADIDSNMLSAPGFSAADAYGCGLGGEHNSLKISKGGPRILYHLAPGECFQDPGARGRPPMPQ
ncbi:hypothetical protein ONZ51_g9447 [Trametes cubensis]|uniref:Uncharacterized protein n=1 Tax=Trametes cubensis TaxID=1111947 RepID=A0AAD7TLD2_9APHY|nr:hypothetical protein ONZ51_g9447 [Trametes cubensis]